MEGTEETEREGAGPRLRRGVGLSSAPSGVGQKRNEGGEVEDDRRVRSVSGRERKGGLLGLG